VAEGCSSGDARSSQDHRHQSRHHEVPGPTIEIRSGEPVRVRHRNELPVPTAFATS